MTRRLLGISTLLFLLAGPAMAQPVVDGSIAGDGYGPAEAVQTVQTNFGDNLSELDAGYCTVVNGRFYLALTGNLENNFNKIELFIDSRAGGENVLSGLPGNDGSGKMAGLTFDAGFAPDFYVIARHGFTTTSVFDLDFAELGTPNSSYYGDVFGGVDQGSALTGIGLNAQPIGVGFDNSNAAGVLGGTGATNQANALAVQTGLELSFDLGDLGYTGGDLRVCAFVNGSNHDYASNQFLGGLQPPQDNLGGDGNGVFTGVLDFDLNNFAGDQFFICTGSATPTEKVTWSRIKLLYR